LTCEEGRKKPNKTHTSKSAWIKIQATTSIIARNENGFEKNSYMAYINATSAIQTEGRRWKKIQNVKNAELRNQ
jgi:hypothetical protein